MLQVDDDVRDRHGEALPRAADHAALEPVRPALGMRRDDDLVRAERPQRVLDRLERLAVPDLAARVDPRLPQPAQARADAQERLNESIAKLADAGVQARGEVGDGDPLQAMEDALRTFGADEIIISTHPEGRSNWLEKGVVEHARERSAVPIRHVVVDLDREREEILH